MMIKKLFTAFCLTICSILSFAQFTAFSENIGGTPVSSSTPVSTYTGYQNYGINGITFGGVAATVRTTEPSSGYATASGGNNVYMPATSNMGVQSTFQTSNINITNATDIKVSFGVFKSTTAENGNNLILAIVVDGSPLGFSPSLPTGAGSAVWHYVTTNVVIPTGSSMTISFLNTAPNGGTQFRLDDILITSATSLPVFFDRVQAVQSNGKLNVAWTTLSESNNDHFDIEVSNDGKMFKKAGTVKSKGTHGYSDQPLTYDYSVSLSQLAALGIIPFIVLLLGVSFKRTTRSFRLFLFLFVSSMMFAIVSCTKENAGAGNINNQKIFIRIAQVDIDGAITYSKIVQVVTE